MFQLYSCHTLNITSECGDRTLMTWCYFLLVKDKELKIIYWTFPNYLM